MKRIAFFSKSKLAFNMIHLILPVIPKQAELVREQDFENKPDFQLVIVDDNFLSNHEKPFLMKKWADKKFKDARKILFIKPDSNLKATEISDLQFDEIFEKPFTAEKLVQILDDNLGSSK